MLVNNWSSYTKPLLLYWLDVESLGQSLPFAHAITWCADDEMQENPSLALAIDLALALVSAIRE